jgi:predicted dehydrogenase
VSSQPLAVGIAGLGRWGRNYIRTIEDTPGCRLVAVADPLAKPGAGGLHLYATAESMLARADITAVVIATPDPTHHEIALRALESGRDVLVEKPMALDPAHAEALIEAAERRGRVLAVAHTPLYHVGFRALQTWLAAQRGAVSARCERTSRGPAKPGPSIVFDLGSHDLALAITLFGEPVELRGAAADETGSRSAFAWQAGFADGPTVQGRLAWTEAPATRYFEAQSAHGRHRFSESPANGTPTQPPLSGLCRDFVACCRERRTPLSDGRLGLAVTRALRVLESASKGPCVGLREASLASR